MKANDINLDFPSLFSVLANYVYSNELFLIQFF